MKKSLYKPCLREGPLGCSQIKTKSVLYVACYNFNGTTNDVDERRRQKIMI